MKLPLTISKYRSWYICQISLQIMLLPILTGTILSKNYDSQLKPNLSSRRFRLGNLFEDFNKTHEKLFPNFTHHHLIALDAYLTVENNNYKRMAKGNQELTTVCQ